MINEPLFEENIVSTIFRNFTFYFFGQTWYIYAVLLGISIYMAYRLLCKGSCTPCPDLFPSPAAGFNLHNRKELAALLFLFLSFSIYAVTMLLQDNSLFNNPDLMSLNTIFIFHRGLAASYGPARMCPVSFFDLNALYAITHNFYIISAYIMLKQALILWLLYCFLNFLSPAKRLFTLGTIQLVPAVFWLNGIIFPEQNILIFILASLLFLKRFSAGKRSGLWGFGAFTLLAVYSKETTVLFYGGILIFAVLYDLYKEKINISHFLHPFRLAGRLPVETMLFLCCLSFALFYLFIMVELKENVYIAFRQADSRHLLNLYKFEIITVTLAWLIAAKKLICREKFDNPLFNEGTLFGASFLLAILIFHLHIAPDLEHVRLKSYYALLSAVFGIVYIARNLKNTGLLICLCGLFLFYAGSANITIAKHEIGHARHEAANFLSSVLQNEKRLSYMLSAHTEETDWVKETWNAALTYYHPGTDITLKMPSLTDDNVINKFSRHQYAKYKKYLSSIKGGRIPVSGDYYVVSTNALNTDFSVIADIPHDLVFENKLFRIYKIR